MSLAPSERNVPSKPNISLRRSERVSLLYWFYKYFVPPGLKDWRSRHESFPASEYLLEVTRNLRADPFSDRHRDAIPDHSIGVVVATRESECVRNSLQPRVFSHRVRR